MAETQRSPRRAELAGSRDPEIRGLLSPGLPRPRSPPSGRLCEPLRLYGRPNRRLLPARLPVPAQPLPQFRLDEENTLLVSVSLPPLSRLEVLHPISGQSRGDFHG